MKTNPAVSSALLACLKIASKGRAGSAGDWKVSTSSQGILRDIELEVALALLFFDEYSWSS